MKPMVVSLNRHKGVNIMSNLENILKESLGCVAQEIKKSLEEHDVG